MQHTESSIHIMVTKMHMRMFTALPPLLCLVIFLHLPSSFTEGVGAENIIRCIERERKALLAFKESIVEDNYGMLSSWGSDVHKRDCCKWWGVRCSNNTGHVISLDLHGNSSAPQHMRAPKVSSSLLELKHLRSLDLSYNEFQWSSIPEFIGSFQRLRVLNLENANFAGAIPSQLGNLTNLRILLLSHNLLNETIAELLEKLATGSAGKSLQILGLSGNQLTGELPANMSTRFLSLRELHARENLLSGSLPLLPSSLEQLDLAINNFDRLFQGNKGFRKASNLMKLDLSFNLITGPFPDLSYFLSLRVLNLSGNIIQGGLSETIGKLSKLQVLNLRANSLEGVITEAHFLNLTSIQKMDLSLNIGLSFNFSDDWIPPFHSLNSMVIGNCKVGPKFPKWLRNQSWFSELDLSSAGISGTIPSWFWDLISPKLRYLNLSHNSIDGTLPDLSNKLSPFSLIDLSFNKFWGPISKFVGDFLILNLSNNKFVGSISFLCSIITQNTLCIDLSDNHFSGKVPDCWNSNISNLQIINFANNDFTGKVPHSLGSLPQLQSLHLRNNNFNGELPSSLQNFTSLRIMDLGENKFTGTIPSWIGSYLTKLTILSLRNNKFNGSMPESLCHLKSIHLLDLSQNKMTGRIPRCFNNFTTLIQNIPFGSIEISYFTITGDNDYPRFYLDNVFVQWKNKDSKYDKQLGFMNCIDLSSNQFIGDIPEELYALKELVSLNLSRNHLTGKIFPTIYEMEKLESLDLSRNQLSGEIPSSLALLTFLGVLDLSNNFLSGKIPKGTQLQTFNASSYAGNNGLCGDPLPKCPTDVPQHGKDNDYQESDDDNLVDREFYISMVLGFSLSFWGLVVSLVLCDKWRLAYYGFFNNVKDGLYVKLKVYLMRLQRKAANA